MPSPFSCFLYFFKNAYAFFSSLSDNSSPDTTFFMRSSFASRSNLEKPMSSCDFAPSHTPASALMASITVGPFGSSASGPLPVMPYFSLAIFSTCLNRSPLSSPRPASEQGMRPSLTAIASATPPPLSHLLQCHRFFAVLIT